MGVGGGLEVGGLLVCLRKLKPWIGSLFGRRGRGGGVKAWQFNGFSLCLSFFFFFFVFHLVAVCGSREWCLRL